METSFYYEQDAFLPEHVKKIDDYFVRLEEGKNPGKKQIKYIGNGLWRLRLSDAARAIFTLVQVNGAYYPYFIECLPTHKYKHSRFINEPQVLQKYKERTVGLCIEWVKKTEEEQAALINSIIQNTSKASKRGARANISHFYQNEFSILDPFQQKILKTNLPCLLSGVAGSGKSLMALKSIEKYVSNLSTTPRRRILYISKSSVLVGQNKAIWKALPASQIRHHTVDFISIEYLIDEGLRTGLSLIDIKNSDTTNSDKKVTFPVFCKQHFDSLNKHQHAHIEIDPIKIREEFFICSGYDEASYLALGNKQSTIPKEDQEKRKHYYAAYKAYLQYIKDNKRIDPDFYALDLDEYDLVVMDEAQDLSPYLINSIHSKANGDNILYCMDSHQRLNSSKSVRPYLLNKIGNEPTKHISLVSTHRCPAKVVAVANKVLNFKQQMVDGLGDKYETPNIQSVSTEKDLGSVYVCNEKNLLDLSWMAQAKQSYFVVITSKSNCENPIRLAAIKAQFNTDNVLSPEQAKGLEYDIVLAYDLYDEEVFRSIKDKAQSLNEESKPTFYQLKNSSDNESCVSFCNEVYTSYTRAKTALIICEKETHLNKVLLDKIKQGADAGLPPEDLFKKQSTKEDWELEVVKQLQVGNEGLARSFYIHLAVDKEQVNQEYDDFVKKLKAKEKSAIQPQKPGANIKYPETRWAEEKKVTNLPLMERKKALSPREEKNRDLSKTKKPAKKLPPVPQFQEKSLPVVIHAATPESKPLSGPESHNSLISILEARLFLQFNESNFINLMRFPKAAKKSIDQILNIKPDGSTQSLLSFIEEDKERTKMFLKWISNNLLILSKMSFEIPSSISSPLIEPLMDLEEIQKFLCNSELDSKELIQKKPVYALLMVNSTLLQNKLMAKKHLSRLRTLVDNGADLNQAGEGINESLIHLAASLGDVEALRFFHDQGMDLAQTRSNGATVAHIAAETGDVKIFRLLKELNFVSLLSQPKNSGKTPAYILARHGHAEAFAELEGLGFELDASINAKGTRPSHGAAERGHLSVLEKFAELHINLDQRTNNGQTPLMQAVTMGELEVVKFLIKQQANAVCSFYVSLADADLIFDKKGYGGGLIKKIEYCIQNAMYNKYSDGGKDPIIPVNLAQLALAMGHDQLADVLKEQIYKKYANTNGFEEQQPKWLEFFEIVEPYRSHFPLPREFHPLMVRRLFNQQSFHPASLTSVLSLPEYEGELDLIKITDANGAELKLLDYMKNHEAIAKVFFKWLANSSYLISKIRCEEPISTEHPFDAKLKYLLEIKEVLTCWNYTSAQEPIHAITETYMDASDNFNILHLITSLYELGADLSVANKYGYQLIHWATFHSHFDMIRFLKSKVDFQAVLPDGRTAAHLAATKDNRALFQLYEELDLTHLLFQSTPGAYTPAHILARLGFSEALSVLADLANPHYKLDAQASNTSDIRPSHLAAEYNKLVVLEKLKSLEVDLDAPSSNGTPFSIAITKGYLDIFHFLIAENINLYRRYTVPLNASNDSSFFLSNLKKFMALNITRSWVLATNYPIPLEELACVHKQKAMASLLIKKKKNKVYQAGTESFDSHIGAYIPLATKLNFEIELHYAFIAAYMNDIELLDDLVKKGVDLTQLDEDGFSLAHFAAQGGHLEVLQWIKNNPRLEHLLANKSKLDITPAFILADEGHAVALKKFVEWSMNINIPASTFGMKPVHIAAQKGHVKVLEVFKNAHLLEEVSDGFKKGFTPLMTAVYAEQVEAVKFLLNSKVKTDGECAVSVIPHTGKNLEVPKIEESEASYLNAYDIALLKRSDKIIAMLKSQRATYSENYKKIVSNKENPPYSVKFWLPKAASSRTNGAGVNTGINP